MPHDPAIQIAAQWDWPAEVGLVITEHRVRRDAGSWPCAVGHDHAGRSTITINHQLLPTGPNGVTSIFKVDDPAASVTHDGAGIAAMPHSTSNCTGATNRNSSRGGRSSRDYEQT